jgi:hypothetical protein
MHANTGRVISEVLRHEIPSGSTGSEHPLNVRVVDCGLWPIPLGNSNENPQKRVMPAEARTRHSCEQQEKQGKE